MTVSHPGYTAKQAVLSGLGLMILGAVFIIWGQGVPRLAYQLFFFYPFLSAIWRLLSCWFRTQDLRENLWITWAKLILSIIFGEMLFLENTAVYLFVFPIAFYQIFTVGVNLITW